MNFRLVNVFHVIILFTQYFGYFLLYGPHLWMVVNYLKTTKLIATKFPEIPGIVWPEIGFFHHLNLGSVVTHKKSLFRFNCYYFLPSYLAQSWVLSKVVVVCMKGRSVQRKWLLGTWMVKNYFISLFNSLSLYRL